MTSLTLLLVRHGETNHNVENRLQGQQDIPLNLRGQRQAKEAKQYLKSINFSDVYSSPLCRAHKTAEIVVGDRPIPIQILSDLKEIGHGNWEGLHPKEIDPWLYKQWQTNPKTCQKPNGESLVDFHQRVTAAWENLVSRHLGEPSATILVVAHKVTIQVILCHVTGVDLEHFGDFDQENCAINIITYENGAPILTGSNIVPWMLSSSLVAA